MTKKDPELELHQTPTDTSDDTADAIGEHEIQSFKKKTVSGALSYTFRSLFLTGVGIGSSFILGIYLAPEAFGIFGIVTQVITLLQFFSDVGLGPALIQKDDEPTMSEYRTVFSVQQTLTWLLFLVAVGLAASGIFTERIGMAGNWVLISLALSIPLGSLKVIPSIILERELDFSKLVIPAIFEQVVYHVSLVIMVVQGMGVISYAYALFFRSIVGVIVMYLIQPWPIGIAWNKVVFNTIVKTGLKFQASDILARIKDNLFYLVMGFFLPIREFGYISWAKQWSHHPYNLTVQNVIAITFPAYSRLQSQTKLLAKAIEKTLFFIALSLFPVLVGMAVFIYPLTVVVPGYAKWQPAVPTFILFALSIGWAAISTPLTNTLNAIGKVTLTLKLMVGWTTLTWVLTPLLVRWYGFNGVALAAFVISFTSIVPMILVKKYIPVQIFSAIWRQLVAAGVMAVVGILGLQVWSQSLWYFLGGMLLVGGVYAITMAAVGWQKTWSEVRGLLAK